MTRRDVPPFRLLAALAFVGLLLFLIITFFTNPTLTMDQRGTLAILRAVFIGTAVVGLGGSAIFHLSTPLGKLSAVGGVAMVVFAYVTVPSTGMPSNPPAPEGAPRSRTAVLPATTPIDSSATVANPNLASNSASGLLSPSGDIKSGIILFALRNPPGLAWRPFALGADLNAVSPVAFGAVNISEFGSASALRGEIAYDIKIDSSIRQIRHMRMDGNDLGPILPGWNAWNAVWSPVNKDLLAFTGGPQDSVPHVYTYQIGGAQQPQLVSPLKDLRDEEHSDQHPAWAPDGRAIAFSSKQTGAAWDIFLVVVDPATGAPSKPAVPVRPPDSRHDRLRPFWSELGVTLSAAPTGTNAGPTAIEIWTISQVGEGLASIFPVTSVRQLTAGDDEQGLITPDLQRLIYTHRTGQGIYELYSLSLNGGAPSSLTPGLDCSTFVVIP